MERRSRKRTMLYRVSADVKGMNYSMHISAKKVLALLCVAAVLTVGVVFAATRFTSPSSAVNSVTKTGDYSADKVTIYGNGVTFIEYTEAITLPHLPTLVNLTNSQNGTNDVQFYLPAGALTDTLTVTGLSVLRITTSQENYPIIQNGDVITVYTATGAYTGKFLSWDTMLLLVADNGTTMIPTDQITKIVLDQVVQVHGPNILVDVLTDSPPGQYRMGVSYLMRGPKWTPTYSVNVETSYLECWATIENVENWNNFTLVLVSGGPHIVYNGPIFEPLILSVQPAFYVASPTVDFAPTSTDEYHEYTYGSKLSFVSGTTVRLPLFNGTVGLRQEYFWSGGDVQNRYHLNDTLDQPLATGTVEFYRGDTWIGEDAISYTPVKAESTLLVNYAYDIKVTSTVTKSIAQVGYEDRGITLTITNHKSTSVQILIQQYIDGYNLTSSTPLASRVGPTLSWTINLDPNQTTTIYYEWNYKW
jgi:hypothetical protein